MKTKHAAIVLLVLLPLLPACHIPVALDEATTPGPDGRTPAGQMAEQIPNIIANPANPFPWIEVLGTLGVLIATAVTGKRYLSTRSVKKGNATTAMMARLGVPPEAIAELVQRGLEALKAAKSVDPPPPSEPRPAPEPAATGGA